MSPSRRPLIRAIGVSAALAGVALLTIRTGVADPAVAPAVPGRWYTQRQVEQGREVYKANCAVCHGKRAEGAADWEVRGDLGFYPPPPLNGSGHSAHHPLEDMLRTISAGGTAGGGVMPAFVDVLGEPDMRAAVAYLQSLWPDDVYRSWEEINSGAKPAPPSSASEAD